jgi:thiosulfate dehydrogenase [quinone] large subunit
MRRVPNRSPGNVESAPRPGVLRPEETPEPSLRERLERASIPARALLPLRFFFGLTFVYAGVDKLLDPAFFDAASPASINGQLAEFARVSPLAPLVRLVEPFALPLGLLIALVEIAIGLGALTGLAFRLAAVGGAVLSFTFWLTASWTTQPYYYGPDLPYAFGWVSLALAGDASLLVPSWVRGLGVRVREEWPRSIRSQRARLRDPWMASEEVSPARRQLLQIGALGAAAVAVASLAVPLRLLRPRSLDGARAAGVAGNMSGSLGSGAGVAPSAAPSAPIGSAPTASATPAPATPAPATSALTIAYTKDVAAAGAATFMIPSAASASLPAGDPGIIVKLADGSYVAYDATCTHRGCPVGWDARDGVLLCPCHGAAFDPANHAAVLGGPTNTPLLELPIVVDAKTGAITLQA